MEQKINIERKELKISLFNKSAKVSVEKYETIQFREDIFFLEFIVNENNFPYEEKIKNIQVPLSYKKNSNPSWESTANKVLKDIFGKEIDIS